MTQLDMSCCHLWMSFQATTKSPCSLGILTKRCLSRMMTFIVTMLCHLVTQMFEPFHGTTMEMYVDDMFVKSKARLDHFRHLHDPFTPLSIVNILSVILHPLRIRRMARLFSMNKSSPGARDILET